MRHRSTEAVSIIILFTLSGCSGSEVSTVVTNVGGSTGGGNTSVAGAANTGGAISQAGALSLGGTSALGTGGTSTIGSSMTGGTKSTGGTANTGGLPATGGIGSVTGGTKSTGGSPGSGGTSATGGKISTGGVPSTGGALPTGGSKASGGTSSTGGSKNATGGITSTGGTRTTGGTSAGGSTSYNPCPTDGTVCKILPLGDSITYGLVSSDGGGYRKPLFRTAVAAGQKITFTGSVTNGPATVTVGTSTITFPANNEGHSGWTIDQIAGLVPSPACNTIPNIVLLMAGTNDVYAASGQSTMQDRLGTLIDKLVSAAPNALIVVATLTPLSNSSWNTTANTYDGKIPAVVQTRVAAGKHVIMVDMSKMPTADLSDGIHPNDTGYAYMANIWYTAISSVLPK